MTRPTILIVTNIAEQNVNQVIPRLERRGCDWFRLNTEAFPLATTIAWNLAGKEVWAVIESPRGRLDTRQVQAVWYRRPVPPALAAGLSETAAHFVDTECRALLNGLISTLHAPWMNRPASEEKAADKLYQLQVASCIGLPVPRTLVTNDPVRARAFFYECGQRVLFKAVSGGAWMRNTNAHEIVQAYGPRLARQPTTAASTDDTAVFIFSEVLTKERLALLEHVRVAPVVFQEFIDKRVDVRVTVVGEALFACRILSQERACTRVDFRRFVNAPAETPRHEPCALPAEIESRLRLLMRRLDLSFGCIDMVVDADDRHVFLEVNPAGQWGWIEHFTGMPISDAVANELAILAERNS